MSKVKIIYQDGEYDCGAACLAMALGLQSASAAYPFLGYNPNEVTPKGVGDDEVMGALRATGRRYVEIKTREYIAAGWGVPPGMLADRVTLLDSQTIRQRLGAMQKGCAIVSVPSLNIAGVSHFVFCSKGEAYDPSRKKRYIGSAQSLPIETAIFIEENP